MLHQQKPLKSCAGQGQQFGADTGPVPLRHTVVSVCWHYWDGGSSGSQARGSLGCRPPCFAGCCCERESGERKTCVFLRSGAEASLEDGMRDANQARPWQPFDYPRCHLLPRPNRKALTCKGQMSSRRSQSRDSLSFRANAIVSGSPQVGDGPFCTGPEGGLKRDESFLKGGRVLALRERETGEQPSGGALWGGVGKREGRLSRSAAGPFLFCCESPCESGWPAESSRSPTRAVGNAASTVLTLQSTFQ